MSLKLTVPNSFFHFVAAFIVTAFVVGAFAYVVLPGVVPNPGHALDTIQGYFQGDASLLQSLAKLQQEVTGQCAAGSSIRVINADGTVSCEADDTGPAGLGGSGTANYLAKWSVATTLANSVLYENGGNIGIGTNAPKNKLDVEGGAVVGSTYSGTNTAPAEGLLVQGNVGIGTNNPSTKLHVVGGIRVTGLTNCNTIDTDAGGNFVCGIDEGGGSYPQVADGTLVSIANGLGPGGSLEIYDQTVTDGTLVSIAYELGPGGSLIIHDPTVSDATLVSIANGLGPGGSLEIYDQTVSDATLVSIANGLGPGGSLIIHDPTVSDATLVSIAYELGPGGFLSYGG